MSKPGKLIVIANVKGGTGKSTLAVNLAGTAADQGKSVLIIDTDGPQFNAASWHAERFASKIENVHCTQITTNTIQHVVPNFMKTYDYVIVDSGARDTNVMRSAMIAAGLHKGVLLIPLTTSQFDAWASIDTLGLLQEVKSIVDTKAFFLLNRIITGTKLENEFKDTLSEFESKYTIPSLKSHIHQRVDMINCLKTGLSVIEINRKGEAANEITTLFNEINDFFTATDAIKGE